jgi:ribosome-interacting GTPase 1
MPANLTPDYKAAEERFRQARTIEDKIAALEEMMAVIPKHKGTDRLRGELRKRYSKLKAEREQQGRKKKHGISYHIPKEEVPQVILVGTPNTGKSSIVAAVTNATPEIANYPFTTRVPAPAMMPYEDIQIQLIDGPPLSPDHIDPWMPELVRNADAAVVVVDLGAPDCVDMYLFLKEALAERGIRLSRRRDPAEHELPRNVKPAIIAANKLDSPEAAENLELLGEVNEEGLIVVPLCAQLRKGVPELVQAVYRLLDIVRIYSKIPGKKPDMEKPFVVPRGSNVLDVARQIHREFGENMKSARVWGSGKFDGQVVDREHVVEDGDILEIHVDM